MLGGNGFNFSFDVGGEKAQVTFKEFIANATQKVVDDPNGAPILALTLSGYGESVNISLKEGEIYETSEYVFNFNSKQEFAKNKKEIAFSYDKEGFFVQAPIPVGWFKMAENKRGEFLAETKNAFRLGELYSVANVNFTARYIGLKGKETDASTERVLL